MSAVGRAELALKLELLKGAFAQGGDEYNIPPFAPVTAVRAAARYEFFSALVSAEAAPVTGLDGNGGFVNEFHSACTLTFFRERPKRSYATIPSTLAKRV